MSTWRDIWRYGVIANRLYSEDSNKGIKAFRKLSEVYPNDGMIHFIYAESLERSGLLKPAGIEYKKLKNYFLFLTGKKWLRIQSKELTKQQ